MVPTKQVLKHGITTVEILELVLYFFWDDVWFDVGWGSFETDFSKQKSEKNVSFTFPAPAPAPWTQLLKPIRTRTCTRTQYINFNPHPHPHPYSPI